MSLDDTMFGHVVCDIHGDQSVTHLGPQTVSLTCGGTGSGGVFIHLGEHEKAAMMAQGLLVRALNPLTWNLSAEDVENNTRLALAMLDCAYGRLV